MLDSPTNDKMAKIDPLRCRYPYCVVWTPIPFLTWLIPFIGHIGIGHSNGVIRDFAASYYVSEDDMAFGKPTKYWKLDISKVNGGTAAYDEAVQKASDVYVSRMLYYDALSIYVSYEMLSGKCHSANAVKGIIRCECHQTNRCISQLRDSLNTMKYDSKQNWNMVKVAIMLMLKSKYVSWFGVAKTYLPFLATLITVILFIIFLN